MVDIKKPKQLFGLFYIDHIQIYFLSTKKETKLRAWSFKMVAMTRLELVTPAL